MFWVQVQVVVFYTFLQFVNPDPVDLQLIYLLDQDPEILNYESGSLLFCKDLHKFREKVKDFNNFNDLLPVPFWQITFIGHRIVKVGTWSRSGQIRN